MLFRSRTPIPKFRIESIEDAYALYVLILKLPEDIFWHAPLRSLSTISEDKAAFDRWQSAEIEREQRRRR